MVHKRKKEVKQLMKKGIHLFTPQRFKEYSSDDALFDPRSRREEVVKFRKLWKDNNSKVAMYKRVAVYENYIPLWRIASQADFFNEAEPNTVYILNYNDLPSAKFKKIVNEIKQFADVKGKIVNLSEDPAGF
jgi:hypothetical protein